MDCNNCTLKERIEKLEDQQKEDRISNSKAHAEFHNKINEASKEIIRHVMAVENISEKLGEMNLKIDASNSKIDDLMARPLSKYNNIALIIATATIALLVTNIFNSLFGWG